MIAVSCELVTFPKNLKWKQIRTRFFYDLCQDLMTPFTQGPNPHTQMPVWSTAMCLTAHWFINSLSKAVSRCVQSGTINKMPCIRCSPQCSPSSPTCEPYSHHIVPIVQARTLGTKPCPCVFRGSDHQQSMSSGMFDDWLTVDERLAAGQHSVSAQVCAIFWLCMRTR